MKKLLSTLAFGLCGLMALAQAPQSFNYQTIIRSTDWEVIQDQGVSLRLTILEDSPAGDVVYQESHAATTSNIGLVNLAIGEGVILSGDFTAIDWGNHSYFIEVGLDATGGNSFVPMGTSQLRSVPYALYAETSNNPGPAGADGEQGIQGEQGLIGTAGTNGANGLDGAVGATGEQGPTGLTGATGANGTNGINGNDGVVGATGEQGPTGLTGATGANGTNGTNGLDGIVGATGEQGIQGIQGETGLQGDQGIAGNDGTAGTNGIQGEQGPEGIGIAQTLNLNGDTLSISGGNSVVFDHFYNVYEQPYISNTNSATLLLDSIIVSQPGLVFIDGLFRTNQSYSACQVGIEVLLYDATGSQLAINSISDLKGYYSCCTCTDSQVEYSSGSFVTTQVDQKVYIYSLYTSNSTDTGASFKVAIFR